MSLAKSLIKLFNRRGVRLGLFLALLGLILALPHFSRAGRQGSNATTTQKRHSSLGNGTRTRAEVLREIAESTEVYNKYYNQAFVVMQYFGYLRRDPDALYLDWIQVLDTTGDFRGMVNGFMNSSEYRFRFGP